MHGQFIMNVVSSCALSIRQYLFPLHEVFNKQLVLIAIKETTIRKPEMQEKSNKTIQ